MRLKIHINNETHNFTYYQSTFDNFPRHIKYKAKRFEMVMYDQNIDGADYVMWWSEMASYHSGFSMATQSLEDLLDTFTQKCECGSKYTGFSWDHMRYCPLWRRWNE